MRTRFHKLFWIWQLQKEEAWINEMASHGYGLISVGRITFDFEDIEPDRYGYKAVFRKGTSNSDNVRDFLKFMEELGIDNVGHVTFPNYTVVYLRYEKSEENLELYSDIDSKIEYEKTMCDYLNLVVWLNVFAWVLNMFIFIMGMIHNVGNFISLVSVINLVIAILCFKSIHTRKKKIKTLTAEREIHE